jgi:hypothetical protein
VPSKGWLTTGTRSGRDTIRQAARRADRVHLFIGAPACAGLLLGHDARRGSSRAGDPRDSMGARVGGRRRSRHAVRLIASSAASASRCEAIGTVVDDLVVALLAPVNGGQTVTSWRRHADRRAAVGRNADVLIQGG